ncbi:MAG TPA: hypothetical protein ENI99_13665 [Sedimenticola sp.]|nr:hypothetical protein [Sedimenticola sp.]
MPDAVRAFLLEFKQTVTTGSGIDLVPRAGARETMRFLGLTKKNVEEILLGLSVADYCAGPKPDHNRPGKIWEFGKDLDGYEVYIKLKVATVGTTKIAKCISFHIAKRPLTYPYR